MRKDDIHFFSCLDCESDLTLKSFQDRGSDKCVNEGVLVCENCHTVYIITEGIPYLIDKGYYTNFDLSSFINRWKEYFDFASFHFYEKEVSQGKMEQLLFFNAEPEDYEDNVSGSIFWRATDANILGGWMKGFHQDETILDIGCGAGRCSIPLLQKNISVIGTDISVGMLKKALKKANEIHRPDVTFFLADAENLPLKANKFSSAISYGMLHHVEEPANILNNVKKSLKPNGAFYALENHSSYVRFIFDWMMRTNKLWDEEAGTHPTFKIKELKNLVLKTGMKPQIKTHIFLPPHFFNAVGLKTSRALLYATDTFFGNLPFFKHFGGQVVVRARLE